MPNLCLFTDLFTPGCTSGTVIRQLKWWLIIIRDIRTAEIVRQHTFQGSSPANCPQSISGGGNIVYTGDDVSGDSINEWLVSELPSQIQIRELGQEISAYDAQLAKMSGTTRAKNLARTRSDWPIFLSDTFDSNENNWFIGEVNNEFATGKQEIINGKYRWEIKTDSGVNLWQSPYEGPISDFYLTVETMQVSGPKSSSHGIAFKATNNGDFYNFLIRDDGYFLVALWQNGEWKNLIDWAQTPAIQSGEVNRLTVDAEQAHFVFFINDQYVGEIDNGQVRAGTAGVAMELGPGEEVIFEFDNFELRTPQAQILTSLSKGERLAQEGKIEEAITAYDEARSLDPTFIIPATSWNILCWYGSLWGYATEVMESCDRAVMLARSDGSYHGSRGLARGLTGDDQGAIEDFKLSSEWWEKNYPEAPWADLAKEWITELEAGGDPFDETTLKELRQE